jgi:ribosomal-protein-alanine N-acetyltransferase
LLRNKEFFSQSEPERDANFYTIDFQCTQLRNDFNFIKNKSMLRLWIFKKDNPNKIIGEVTFYNIFPFVFSSCHIGYKSDTDEINKGIITEAVKKGIEIIFNEYGLHRIEAHVLP